MVELANLKHPFEDTGTAFNAMKNIMDKGMYVCKYSCLHPVYPEQSIKYPSILGTRPLSIISSSHGALFIPLLWDLALERVDVDSTCHAASSGTCTAGRSMPERVKWSPRMSPSSHIHSSLKLLVPGSLTGCMLSKPQNRTRSSPSGKPRRRSTRRPLCRRRTALRQQGPPHRRLEPRQSEHVPGNEG